MLFTSRSWLVTSSLNLFDILASPICQGVWPLKEDALARGTVPCIKVCHSFKFTNGNRRANLLNTIMAWSRLYPSVSDKREQRSVLFLCSTNML
jgi:hypothetical protein